jgi:hypothetical protein
MSKEPELFSENETARRRDEVIRRMANTPPQPKLKSHRQRRKKGVVADRAVRKDRDVRKR